MATVKVKTVAAQCKGHPRSPWGAGDSPCLDLDDGYMGAPFRTIRESEQFCLMRLSEVLFISPLRKFKRPAEQGGWLEDSDAQGYCAPLRRSG